MEKYRFPDGFFWGGATSAHQVEGGNTNDWSEWEKENSERLTREAEKEFGHLANWPDIKTKAQYPQNYISGKACDHYNRYEEDFDIAKSLGHNAHRFSIEWSRIEPEEGKWNEKEIEHYRNVLIALKKRNIEPFVTLWHWPLPLWIKNTGGWENKKTLKYFLRYTEKVIDSFGDKIKFWIPINEPTVYAGMAYIKGEFPPQVKSHIRGNRVLKNLISAHNEVYQLLHQKLGDSIMVGSAHNMHYHVPFNQSRFLDRLSAKFLDYIRDRRHLGWIKGNQDFIGLNYYYRDTVKFKISGGRLGLFEIKNPDKDVSDMGWDIYPEGIYWLLKKIKSFNLPIYVTESGLADAGDAKREKFIKEHLFWIGKAIDEGVDVRGYLYWSLFDNFEWNKGFWPRFGLVEVNYNTQERKIRESAKEYAKICESNELVI